MGLINPSIIKDGESITLDSAPIIYILDGNPKFASGFLPLFQDIESGRIRAVISPITIAEVISGPLNKNNEILVDRYYKMFTSTEGWFIQDMNAEISMIAARIRTQYRLKLPDAIQIATTIYSGSTALVTHDRDFKGLDEVTILGI